MSSNSKSSSNSILAKTGNFFSILKTNVKYINSFAQPLDQRNLAFSNFTIMRNVLKGSVSSFNMNSLIPLINFLNAFQVQRMLLAGKKAIVLTCLFCLHHYLLEWVMMLIVYMESLQKKLLVKMKL